MDDAEGRGIAQARVAPGENGLDGFGSVTFAVRRGGQDPAGFAEIFDRGKSLAGEATETGFAEESAGRFFLENPETEAEQRPETRVAHEFVPGFLFGERASAEKAGDAG